MGQHSSGLVVQRLGEVVDVKPRFSQLQRHQMAESNRHMGLWAVVKIRVPFWVP